MSNIFKSNTTSRFDILGDSNPSYIIVNNNYNKNNEKNVIKKTNNFIQNSNKSFAFNENSFPELIESENEKKKEENIIKANSFTDILKLEKEKEEQIPTYRKGWVTITKLNQYKKEPETKSEPNCKQAVKLLATNYEKWKANYIKTWSIDDYYSEYRPQNHNYDYFENSDSEYVDSNSDYEEEKEEL
jgi:hypothetical protein